MSGQERRLIALLNLARDYLDKKGVENPRGNAEALLSKALGLPRIQLYLQHDRPLNDSEVAAFRELLRRRSMHEPLQLIIGSVEFFGSQIEITPGLLVPRPETEYLAVIVSQKLPSLDGIGQIRLLDIGTGTGCIAVSIARSNSRIVVDAVDVDFSAVRQAIRNAALNGVGQRVNAFHADVFSERFVETVSPPYHAVVSNPPYITAMEHAGLPPEVRLHESPTAHVGGTDGMDYFRRIVDLAPRLLTPNGLLAFEVGEDQSQRVVAMLNGVTLSTDVVKDLTGRDRYVLATLTGVLP